MVGARSAAPASRASVSGAGKWSAAVGFATGRTRAMRTPFSPSRTDNVSNVVPRGSSSSTPAKGSVAGHAIRARPGRKLDLQQRAARLPGGVVERPIARSVDVLEYPASGERRARPDLAGHALAPPVVPIPRYTVIGFSMRAPSIAASISRWRRCAAAVASPIDSNWPGRTLPDARAYSLISMYFPPWYSAIARGGSPAATDGASASTSSATAPAPAFAPRAWPSRSGSRQAPSASPAAARPARPTAPRAVPRPAP